MYCVHQMLPSWLRSSFRLSLIFIVTFRFSVASSHNKTHTQRETDQRPYYCTALHTTQIYCNAIFGFTFSMDIIWSLCLCLRLLMLLKWYQKTGNICPFPRNHSVIRFDDTVFIHLFCLCLSFSSSYGVVFIFIYFILVVVFSLRFHVKC